MEEKDEVMDALSRKKLFIESLHPAMNKVFLINITYFILILLIVIFKDVKNIINLRLALYEIAIFVSFILLDLNKHAFCNYFKVESKNTLMMYFRFYLFLFAVINLATMWITVHIVNRIGDFIKMYH